MICSDILGSSPSIPQFSFHGPILGIFSKNFDPQFLPALRIMTEQNPPRAMFSGTFLLRPTVQAKYNDFLVPGNETGNLFREDALIFFVEQMEHGASVK